MSDVSINTARLREGGIAQGPEGRAAFVSQEQRARFLVSMRRTPEWKPLIEQYPSFAVGFADHMIATNNDPDPMYVGMLMSRYNVPQSAIPYLFRSSGGGGRSQQDRENIIRTFQTSILFRAKQLGLNLKPEEVDYIARVAEAQNYSAEQVDAALTGLIKWDSLQGGTLTAARDSINTLAKDYLVSLTDDLVRDWSTRLATGAATTEGFKSVVMAQAKLQNPWLATYIDQGLSPNELLDPGRRQIATSLGLNPAEIDFSDPTNMNLVTTKDDKGNTRLATIPEIRTNIRMDPRWEATDEARQTAASMARLLSEVFGRSAF